jgi:FKBP-type peptidyl-prolyl cis-trans isomerase FkpA
MVRKLAILLLLVYLLGCSKESFKTHETGLQYKFITENKNEIKPVTGDVISLKMEYTDSKGVSVERTENFRTQLKKPTHAGGSIEIGISLMHKGDSAVFLIKAIDYYTKTLETALPERFSENDYLHFYVKLVDVKSIDAFQKERQVARLSDKREEETQLNDFLKRINFTGEPTMSGLYFIELKKGTGDSPKPGKNVSVHYLGYFIDGQIFDSSYKRNQPFSFRYGVGQVIEGWDEGLSKMKVGGKYKLVVPSYLGYGSEAVGPIPPNSTLVFEIELISIE